MEPQLSQANMCQTFNLTAAQHGLWFNFLLWPERCNNLAEALEVFGPLEPDRLQLALKRMIDETDGLRTTFFDASDGPRQFVSGEANGEIIRREFSSRDAAWDWMRSDAVKPVDLRAKKLATAALIKVAEEHWFVYYRIPHILADGFAGMLFADRLLKYYTGTVEHGETDEHPLLGHEVLLSEDDSYRRSGRIGRDAEYWCANMRHGFFPQSPLPVASTWAGPNRAQLALPDALNTRLDTAAAELKLSRSQLLTALTTAYLHRILNAECFTYGLPVSARIGRRLRRTFGMTSNILPLNSHLQPEESLASYCAAFSKSFREALRHQKYRLEDIRKDLALDPTTPLFNVTINVEPFALPPSPADFKVDIHNLSNGLHADLDIFFFDKGTRTEIVAESGGLYRDDELKEHLARLLVLSANILDKPNDPISSIDILPQEERRLIIEGFNETQADYPSHALLHELFEVQAKASPDAVALVYGDEQLSYGELNTRANRLAHHLVSLGVKPDDRVAICVERSIEMVVGLLAILKAGGAYVPLDPAYPAERLAYMLGDCEPAIILTHAPARQALSIALGMGQDREEQDVGLPIFDLVADAALWEKAPAHAPNIRATGMTCANLAYVIYTSGSTGKPKGVMVEHRSIVNTITHLIRTYDIKDADRLLSFSSISFDMSVEDIFSALLAGASLCLRTDDWISDPRRFTLLCEQFGITILNLPPSFWASLPLQCPATVRLVALGGEAAAKPVLLDWLAHNKEFPALFNAYGPAEAAVNAAMTRVNPERAVSNSIGRPIANTRIYILDGSGAPVPIGVAGELHIAGAGVARGYLNRPELTAERFLADPFSPVCGSRMYKTGDLGRWLPDGTIEYLGRNDFQVKIRGFRIELGEIENRLTTLEGVAKAVVVAWEVDEGDDKRLVAYYTLAEGAADLEAEELRAHLAAALPDYMVPSAYVAMDALPLTPNGKLDRKALPAPDASAYARQQYEAPQGHVEQTLADIWSELLGLEQIGRHDSFFDLGGHSLLAVRMIARLSEHGLSLDVPQLFFHPVLKDLATQVAVNEGDVAPIPRAHRDGPIGLSFAQQRLWFVSQLEGASQAYHMPAGLRLRGDLDEVALVRALDRIVYRHEVLRTRFVKAGDEPVQVIDPAGIGFALVKKDLSSTRHQDSDDQLRALIEAEASAPFDLAAGPLIRGTLVRLGEQDHALLVTMHHIISDGWSIGVLVSEFNQLYEAYCTDQPDPLPSLPIQYADYALWQKEQDLTPLIDYWTGSLAGYSAPLDLSRSGQGGRAPGPARLLRRPVPQDLTAELHAFAADNNITLFMLLMTGLTLLAHRRTGRTDVAFGTTVAGRNRVELEPLIGFFINILPLRVTVEGHMSAAQLIEHVREVSIHGLNHADLPFEQLIATVPELRNSSGHALLPVLIRHQNFPQEELGGWSSNLQAQLIAFEELRPAKCDLDIQYHGDATRLETLIEYDADRFSAQEVTAILDELEQLLGRLIRQPKARVDELTAISPEETSLLADWNKTLRTFEATTIPELFARQVSASPDAVACFDKDMAYSFAELEARSNAFARLLVTRGAKPGDRIALYLPRSVDFLAALLGVFKIGGIYVAIPPSYPGNYIERILENADPSIIVTVPDLAGELTPSAETAVLTAEESHDQQSTPLETPVTWQPDQIAYIAYTSGSTAEPTGIAVPHRQFLNCLQALWDHIPFADDEVVAQKTPSAFVVSLKEMLGALLAGVPQVIISDDESRDIDRLIKSLARHRVTRLNIVPSHLAALLEHRPDLPALRHIITAGEPLTQSLRASAHTLFVGACIHNNYGCTELNDIAYSDPDEQNSRQGMSPVGRPIANTRIHILNEKLELLPIGAVGEIFVEGASIPAGYWRRPDLDDRRLVPNPIDPKSPPLFRTGDLGRWRYDGQLDYCGRSDAQTKILGQRVDLLMVEATLKLHPDIAAGAVMTQRTETGETRIVAYYVPANGKPIDPDLLRSWFSTKLPNYMLPNLYKHLDALPTLPNGKLDRRSLLSMPTDTEQALDRTPPQTDVERTIARIWSEILNIPLNTISRQDNFFALGGQSLLAVKMIARLNEAYQPDIPIKLIFAAGNLEVLAQLVDILDSYSRGNDTTLASVLEGLAADRAELLLDALGAPSDVGETSNRKG